MLAGKLNCFRGGHFVADEKDGCDPRNLTGPNHLVVSQTGDEQGGGLCEDKDVAHQIRRDRRFHFDPQVARGIQRFCVK